MSDLQQIFWLMSPMMRGDDVWKAQTLLGQNGLGVRADGIFGHATREAIRTFQARANLRSDGILGPLTWAALSGQQEMPVAPSSSQILSADKIAALKEPHSRFPGSVVWNMRTDGLYIDGNPVASAGAALVEKMLVTYTPAIAAIVPAAPVPLELVIATICAESSGRTSAIRFEPGCDVNNPDRTPSRVSMGLMQTLLSTAASALDQSDLRVSDLAEPATSLRAGMFYMWNQALRTGYDPPLVAAAYNAGNVIYNGGSGNRWRLKQYPIGTGAHVDRFVGFMNAAMTAIAGGRFIPPSNVPTLSGMLSMIVQS